MLGNKIRELEHSILGKINKLFIFTKPYLRCVEFLLNLRGTLKQVQNYALKVCSYKDLGFEL